MVLVAEEGAPPELQPPKEQERERELEQPTRELEQPFAQPAEELAVEVQVAELAALLASAVNQLWAAEVAQPRWERQQHPAVEVQVQQGPVSAPLV